MYLFKLTVQKNILGENKFVSNDDGNFCFIRLKDTK